MPKSLLHRSGRISTTPVKCRNSSSDHDAFVGFSSGNFQKQIGCPGRSQQHRFRIDTSLKPKTGFRNQPQPPTGSTNETWIKIGCLQKDIGRSRGQHRFARHPSRRQSPTPAHDQRSRDHQDPSSYSFPSSASHSLAGIGHSNNNASSDFREIERMKRLTKLQEHVIGRRRRHC